MTGVLLTFIFVGVALAYDGIVGNDATLRSVTDTRADFSIVDTNNPSNITGVLTKFDYFASTQNVFRFVLVDAGNVVKWISEEITPDTVGLNTYTPASPVHVETGWNVGMYFKSTGTIPFTWIGDPAWYTAGGSGVPVVGSTIIFENSSNRVYSFVASGWKTLITPSVNGFLSPALSCGALTNIHSTTVDWTDSTGGVDGLKGYEYAVDYPTGGGTGHWTAFFTGSQYTGTLNEGTHTVKVRAQDNAGNYSDWSNSCSVTTDWTAPDVVIDSPAGNTNVSGSVEIRGTVTDLHPHHYWLAIYSGSTLIWNSTVNRTDSFTNQLLKTWNTTLLNDGSYVIKLAARDAADNRSSDVQVTVNIDNDADDDGIKDNVDNCTSVANPDQANNDGDNAGDACDEDNDNDTLADNVDNCPLAANTDQANTDGDSEGNVCDTDDDNDSVADNTDNCPLAANADQADQDKDGIGDVCDPDDDNDTVADTADNCTLAVNPGQEDFDKDGEGDVCDDDVDGDRLISGDKCSLTASDNFSSVGINRWNWVKETGWSQPNKSGKNLEGPISITDTYGCSCKQILDLLKAESGEDLEGQYKYGCSTGILKTFINSPFELTFTATDSLYYDTLTPSDQLYGTGEISFTWNKYTGIVNGGYYDEIVPPYTGTHYYNTIVSGNVIGNIVNLHFVRGYYEFNFIGTLENNVLTGTLAGPYYFTATGI